MGEARELDEVDGRLGTLVDEVRSRGPVTITRNGVPVVVVVAAESWPRFVSGAGAAANQLGAGVAWANSEAPSLGFDLETLWPDEDDSHFLHGIVHVNGVAHFVRAWEVVDELQNPHPSMRAEHSADYEEITSVTTPGVARAVVAMPGLPGRWVVVVAP